MLASHNSRTDWFILIKATLFWVVTLCRLVGRHQRFWRNLLPSSLGFNSPYHVDQISYLMSQLLRPTHFMLFILDSQRLAFTDFKCRDIRAKSPHLLLLTCHQAYRNCSSRPTTLKVAQVSGTYCNRILPSRTRFQYSSSKASLFSPKNLTKRIQIIIWFENHCLATYDVLRSYYSFKKHLNTVVVYERTTSEDWCLRSTISSCLIWNA
jgi:hypothetical protein